MQYVTIWKTNGVILRALVTNFVPARADGNRYVMASSVSLRLASSHRRRTTGETPLSQVKK